MTAFLLRMPSGIPGNVGRIEAATIEAMVVNTTAPPNRFGDPVCLATLGNLGVRPMIAVGDVATCQGFLVRPYPTQGAGAWPSDFLPAAVDATVVLPPAGVPALSGICNVMRRGYISVAVCGPVLAVKGAPVCVVTSAGTAAIPLGALVAVIGTNATVIPGAFFQGPQDAQGNCEISVFVGPHQ